jgi:nitroreductase
MDFQEVVRRRRMTRSFTAEPLAEGTTERILRTANRAPSAGFSQGYAWIVLDTPTQLAPFWRLAGAGEPSGDDATDAIFAGLANAPLVIVPLSCKSAYLNRYAEPDKGWSDGAESHWPVPYWDIDTGFTVLLMLLAAENEGLGALFFGFGMEAGETERFREHYGVPADHTPIGAVAVGHPDPSIDHRGSARRIARRPLEQVAHRGQW